MTKSEKSISWINNSKIKFGKAISWMGGAKCLDTNWL